MELLVVEQSGWSKSFDVVKGVTRIGSAPASDIQLPSPGVSPVHLQVFYSPKQPEQCKVLNLGADVTISRLSGQQKLNAFASMELGVGDELLIDAYKIIFKLPVTTGVMRASASIQASLSFTETTLRPDIVNVGTLTIKNMGKKASCQFQVRLSGIAEECFKIDPVPMLPPDAQEQVHLYLFHREILPLAGFQEFKVSVSAPESYPGEEIILRQGIYVMPVFDFELDLDDDMPASAVVVAAPKLEIPPSAHIPTPIGQESAIPAFEPETPQADTNEPPKENPAERVVKLVQNPSDDYWS